MQYPWDVMCGWLCVEDVVRWCAGGDTESIMLCGGVWRAVDADNRALGTAGVQTLLDALPAAAMKHMQFESTYGHMVARL